MKLAYEPVHEVNEAVKDLAKELVVSILKAGATYRDAEDALEEAQRILWNSTKPTLSA